MKVQNEPAAALGVVGAIIALLVAYGLMDANKAPMWSALAVAVVPLVQAWVTRHLVMPVSKIRDAGLSPQQITNRAEIADGKQAS